MNDRPDDQIVTFDQMRRTIRSRGPEGLQQVLRTGGSLAARLTMLGIAIEDRESEPQARNYPPAVFIAYKWGEPEHQAWVRDLAEELKRRGYRVLLDRDHLAEDASNFDEVPAYIARLVGSDICLVVVTEAYLDLVEARHHKTSWVFDEFNTAVSLANHGRLWLCAIWKDPAVRPASPTLRAHVIDARHAPLDPSVLDADFPPYAGPTLDDGERARLLTFVRQADEMLSDPDPNLPGIRDWLAAHQKFEQLYDFQVRLSRLYWLSGMAQEAYVTALPLLPECRDPDQALQFAQALDSAGAHSELFRFLHRARGRGVVPESASLHYFLGETLVELNSPIAARNHFQWLRSHRDLARLPERLQVLIDERLAALDEAWATLPDGDTFACDACDSRYRLAGAFRSVCGECATLYAVDRQTCPVCANERILPLELLTLAGPALAMSIRCPICTKGTMKPLPS